MAWADSTDDLDVSKDCTINDPKGETSGETDDGASLRPIGAPPKSAGEGESEETSSPGPAVAQDPDPDFRSKTERRFWRKLQRCDLAAWTAFEPVSRRIGPKRHYRPDFEVQRTDGGIEYIEVKGYIRDRSLVKPSAAARLYPMYDWAVVQQSSKGAVWTLKWLEPNRRDRPETVAERLCGDRDDK